MPGNRRRSGDLPRLILVIGGAKLALILALWAGASWANGFLRLEGHGGPVKGVAVSGDRALTASFDYSVGLWDLKTGRELQWLEGHDAAANAVAFLCSDDANYITAESMNVSGGEEPH